MLSTLTWSLDGVYFKIRTDIQRKYNWKILSTLAGECWEFQSSPYAVHVCVWTAHYFMPCPLVTGRCHKEKSHIWQTVIFQPGKNSILLSPQIVTFCAQDRWSAGERRISQNKELHDLYLHSSPSNVKVVMSQRNGLNLNGINKNNIENFCWEIFRETAAWKTEMGG